MGHLPLPEVLQLIYLYQLESQFRMNELSELENRIKDKITQTKHKMHETQERTVTDRLWPEIETLNWVLNEILVLSRSLDRAD
jgi:hypothetical protein